MVDVVEESLKITVYNPVLPLPYDLLNVTYSLMGIPVGTKPITVVMEFVIPFLMHDLCYGLLDQTVEYDWDAQLAFASIRFGDFHSQDGFRAVGSFNELLANHRPVLLEKGWKIVNGHTVHARSPFIALNLFQRTNQIVPVQNARYQR